jgi:hypothetical protein
MRNQFPRSAQFRFPVSKCAIALLCCAFSGGLDILVNNAGILIRGVVDDYSLKDFDRMVAVNVRAVFIAIKAAVPHLKNGGRIITTGSVVADRSGFPGASVYSMTKAAVAALTRGLARDLGSRAITANVIQPGPTETDMNANPAVNDTLRALMAIGRIGKDVEVASLVAYPETALRLHVKGSAASVQCVLDRRCAVGVVVSHIPTPLKLARKRLTTVKMAMVVSPNHPLAAYDRPIPTAVLTKYIQLVHTNRRDLLPGREFDLLSPKTWLLAHIEAKLAFLRAGFGFGALPLHLVERDLASGALVQIRTEESHVCDHAIEMSALYRIDSPPGPATRWLIERLMQEDGPRLGKSAGVSLSTVNQKPSRARSPVSKYRRRLTAVG